MRRAAQPHGSLGSGLAPQGVNEGGVRGSAAPPIFSTGQLAEHQLYPSGQTHTHPLSLSTLPGWLSPLSRPCLHCWHNKPMEHSWEKQPTQREISVDNPLCSDFFQALFIANMLFCKSSKFLFIRLSSLSPRFACNAHMKKWQLHRSHSRSGSYTQGPHLCA